MKDNKGKPKKKSKSGAIHKGGKTALSFKKGSKNYTEIPTKKHSGKMRSEPAKKKPIPGNKQDRAAGESVYAFSARRNEYRKRLANKRAQIKNKN